MNHDTFASYLHDTQDSPRVAKLQEQHCAAWLAVVLKTSAKSRLRKELRMCLGVLPPGNDRPSAASAWSGLTAVVIKTEGINGGRYVMGCENRLRIAARLQSLLMVWQLSSDHI